MNDLHPFGLIILVVAGAGLLAVLSHRVSERARVPAPLFFLAGAALIASLVPDAADIPHQSVERVVTVALVLILFDGGMGIGWRRLRTVAAPVAVVGVLGTFLTTGAVAVLAHFAFGFDWWISLLVGAAIAPTDPAVVFSVLGRKAVGGRAGTILEGESGANDPVGIALMVGLLGAGAVSGSALAGAGGGFLVQMGVGALVGLVGGVALKRLVGGASILTEGMYPLATLTGAGVLFGVATVAHGSGFLAVFVAGIVLGDLRTAETLEIRHFHGALASLGEIVAFVLLGLTIELRTLADTDVWIPGLILGVALAFVIRPALVGLCLLPFGLPRNERLFVLWAGLKGAVPILLGGYLLSSDVADSTRLYGIVVVVTGFSVLVQGSTVPAVAKVLRVWSD